MSVSLRSASRHSRCVRLRPASSRAEATPRLDCARFRCGARPISVLLPTWLGPPAALPSHSPDVLGSGLIRLALSPALPRFTSPRFTSPRPASPRPASPRLASLRPGLAPPCADSPYLALCRSAQSGCAPSRLARPAALGSDSLCSASPALLRPRSASASAVLPPRRLRRAPSRLTAMWSASLRPHVRLRLCLMFAVPRLGPARYGSASPARSVTPPRPGSAPLPTLCSAPPCLASARVASPRSALRSLRLGPPRRVPPRSAPLRLASLRSTAPRRAPPRASPRVSPSSAALRSAALRLAASGMRIPALCCAHPVLALPRLASFGPRARLRPASCCRRSAPRHSAVAPRRLASCHSRSPPRRAVVAPVQPRLIWAAYRSVLSGLSRSAAPGSPAWLGCSSPCCSSARVVSLEAGASEALSAYLLWVASSGRCFGCRRGLS